MATIDREPRESADAPLPACGRCSKPIRPGMASQMAGRPVHLRCLAIQTRLEAVELREETRRTLAMRGPQPFALPRGSAPRQLDCPACGRSLVNAGSVLFQGDQLVHALCWRSPEPEAQPPAPPRS